MIEAQVSLALPSGAQSLRLIQPAAVERELQMQTRLHCQYVHEGAKKSKVEASVRTSEPAQVSTNMNRGLARSLVRLMEQSKLRACLQSFCLTDLPSSLTNIRGCNLVRYIVTSASESSNRQREQGPSRALAPPTYRIQLPSHGPINA